MPWPPIGAVSRSVISGGGATVRGSNGGSRSTTTKTSSSGVSVTETADHPGPVGIEFWENYAALAAEPRHFTGTVEVAGTTVRTKRWIRSVAPVGRSGQVDGFIVLALPQNDNRG